MTRYCGIGLAFAASLVSTYVLWFTELPLGIPGEWTWPRLPADAQSGWNLLLAGLWAGVYLAFVEFGRRRLSVSGVRKLEVSAWMTGLVVMAVSWLWMVQETAPSAGQLAKAPFILYYPSSSGYFTKVRYEAPHALPFLRGYEQLMEQGDVLHVGTHPPGLFLFYHGLMTVSERCPGILNATWSFAPESVREATAIVIENSRLTPQPMTLRDAQLLWMTGLIVLGMNAATTLPLYGALRLKLSREAAFLGAALWPTVPAAAIFWPKSDVVFPCLATWLVWCAFSAWSTGSRIRACMAGFVLFLGLVCSLAFLPVALFAALVIGERAVDAVRQHTRPVSQVTIWTLCGFAAFFLPILILSQSGIISMERVWLWNYRNHAGFYAQFPRSYAGWLLINPVELGLAVGAPLIVAAVSGAWQSRTIPAAKDWWSVVLWGAAVWGLLWLTGKNSGEAARLWLLLMPGLVAVAARGLAPGETHRDFKPTISPIYWLALQLGVSILTVHRIGGFHFEAL